MKRLNFLLILIGVTFFIFSCSEDDPTSPESNQVTMFSGTENPVATHDEGTWSPLPNGLAICEGAVFEYRIESTDPRVTGKVMYYTYALFDTNFVGQYWGTGEVIPDNGGSWDMKFLGERPVSGGSAFEIIAHGKGVLDGLTAQWKGYVLPGETEGTVEGFIVE